LHFINHDEFVYVEDEHGVSVHIYSDADRLEVELCRVAPHHAANARPPHGQKSDLEDRAKRLSP